MSSRLQIRSLCCSKIRFNRSKLALNRSYILSCVYRPRTALTPSADFLLHLAIFNVRCFQQASVIGVFHHWERRSNTTLDGRRRASRRSAWRTCCQTLSATAPPRCPLQGRAVALPVVTRLAQVHGVAGPLRRGILLHLLLRRR